MSEIFISYSRQDGDEVSFLARELENAGYKVWLDRSAIQGGARWQEEIVRGIHRANIFLIVLSRQSIASENVERELGLAHITGKRILPVMLHQVAVPQRLQYALGSRKAIDISTEEIETACPRVLQAIASPGARTGIVYLDALWHDKLPLYLSGAYFAFVVLVGPFLQEGWKEEWNVPVALLILVPGLLAISALALRRIYIDSCLKRRGIVLCTELRGFTRFRARYRIASSWRDPETGNYFEFYSRKTSFDSLGSVDRTVPVTVDCRNFKRYRMDLPSTPSVVKDAAGSFAPADPSEFENHVNRPDEGAHEIFLSHSEQDAEAVGRLLQKLEVAGYALSNAIATEKDDEQVIDRISRARLFLLVLSPDSMSSSRVRGELDLAVSKAKRIVVAVLRRTSVPQGMNYALARVPHVDLSQDLEAGLAGLVDTIATESTKVTVVRENAAAARAAWLKAKLRPVLLMAGWIPVFMPLVAIALILAFLCTVLPVRLRPLQLQAKCARWLGFWDDALEVSDFRWLTRARKNSEGRPREHKDKVILLATEYVSFEARDNGCGIRIVSQWRDPVSKEGFRFRSNWVICAPEQIRTTIIPVYADRTNLRRYTVDLSFLPDLRREVPRPPSRLFGTRAPVATKPESAAPLRREQEEVAESRVFISHSREDIDKAHLVIERLEQAGYEVVNRSEIEGTQTSAEASDNRIGLAATSLIIVPSAAASDLESKVLELRQAYTLHRRIIPISFNDYVIPPSMQLSLAGVQSIDLSHDIESGMRVLLNALPSRKSGEAETSDHPKTPSPSLFGAPNRNSALSAMMGAFSWTIGLILSIEWLDRSPAIPGLIPTAAVVALVYGSVVGAIFHGRRIKPKRLFVTAFVSLVLFPVAVALFVPDHTINSGRDTRALMLTPVLGVLAFVAAKLIYLALFNHRLKKKGKLILTEYQGSGISQWRDPATDKVHTFEGGESGIFSKPIQSNTVAVFMDPANPTDYFIDLSYRPESKE